MGDNSITTTGSPSFSAKSVAQVEKIKEEKFYVGFFFSSDFSATDFTQKEGLLVY